MESLYKEMLEMRDHLLKRIELLEDDVERLTKENYQYAKELYQKRLSVDLSASIVAKILNCDKKITNNKKY